MMYEIDGFVFDLDGTVYLGEHALPGAVEAIAELRRKGKKTLFVSNKPVEPGRNYATKLTRLGIPTTSGDVITSALVLGHHLSKTAPLLKLYVVGEQSLRQELREHGLDVLDELPGQDPQGVIDPSGIDAVVIAFDRTIDYRKLNTAYQALRAGARFFATNADPVCPMPGGAIPDAGATIRALESITGRDLELLAGKPSPLMMQVAMQRMELPPERCMLIGDRLETDLRMGQEAGFVTAVVLTGVTKRSDLARLTRTPDIVLENLGELLAWVS
jgi:arabinose operon protein AraL